MLDPSDPLVPLMIAQKMCRDAVDAEREACAKIADEHDRKRNVIGSGQSIAAAIRARSR